MNITKTLGFAAVAATLLFQTPTLRADDKGDCDGPRRITFEKCWVVADEPFGGHFAGTVASDCGAGTVSFTYMSILQDLPFVRFSGEYTVNITPACSFKTVCAGEVDTRTGRIELNGVVTDGPSIGDLVRVRARLNAAGNCSAGTMTITPTKRK